MMDSYKRLSCYQTNHQTQDHKRLGGRKGND